MSAPPSSISGTASSTVNSDIKSAAASYGAIIDDAAQADYQNGQLSWKDGNYAIKDEDVIVVTSSKDSHSEYIIWSLNETSLAAEPDSKQPPFELRTTHATTLPKAFLQKYLFEALPAYLDPTKNDVHVLVSILSGTKLALPFFDNVLRAVLSAGGLQEPSYNAIQTSSADFVAEFARSVLLAKANEGKKQTILLLSGDGGIVDIINGLLESGERSSSYIKPVLCQLPLGTGNALFHSLHRPSTLPSLYIQALRTLLFGKPHPLPIFQAKFSLGARALSNEGRTATPLVHNTIYGAVVASYGLHSTLVADSDTTEYRKHGAKRFGLVANDLLFPPGGATPHAYSAEVTLFKDGNEAKIDRKEHGYILASLVSNLEKPFTISPASKPLDGQLRVIHFGSFTGEKTMNVMKEAYNNGNHISLDGVGYESVSGIKIHFNEAGEDWKWRRCCIDGLIVGIEEGGWIEVRTVKPGTEAVDIVVDP